MAWSRAGRRLARPLPFLAALALAALLAPPAPAQVFTDDFNDGNDTGWTRYDPLTQPPANFPPSTWSFPGGNTYRIQPAQPPSLVAGQARSGSFVSGLSYTDFFVSADLVNWNNTIAQSFGLGARIINPGLGTTNGYAFLYDTTNGEFNIYRVTGEQVTSFGEGTSLLTAGNQYRFTLEGVGNTFTGRVFNVTNLNTPLLTVTGTDGQYASGVAGLIVSANANILGPGDATFDNYFSSPSPIPEPATWALASLGLASAWAVRRRRSPPPLSPGRGGSP
jgi:MYXO-CTERM domain-containing protein